MSLFVRGHLGLLHLPQKKLVDVHQQAYVDLTHTNSLNVHFIHNSHQDSGNNNNGGFSVDVSHAQPSFSGPNGLLRKRKHDEQITLSCPASFPGTAPPRLCRGATNNTPPHTSTTQLRAWSHLTEPTPPPVPEGVTGNQPKPSVLWPMDHLELTRLGSQIAPSNPGVDIIN